MVDHAGGGDRAARTALTEVHDGVRSELKQIASRDATYRQTRYLIKRALPGAIGGLLRLDG